MFQFGVEIFLASLHNLGYFLAFVAGEWWWQPLEQGGDVGVGIRGHLLWGRLLVKWLSACCVVVVRSIRKFNDVLTVRVDAESAPRDRVGHWGSVNACKISSAADGQHAFESLNPGLLCEQDPV